MARVPNNSNDPSYADGNWTYVTPTIRYTPAGGLALDPAGVNSNDLNTLKGMTGGYTVVPAPPSPGGCFQNPDSHRSITIVNLNKEEHAYACIPFTEGQAPVDKAILLPQEASQSIIPTGTSLAFGTAESFLVTSDCLFLEIEGVVVSEWVNSSGTLQDAGGYRVLVEKIGNDLLGALQPNFDNDPQGKFLEIENQTSGTLVTGLRNIKSNNPNKYLDLARLKKFDQGKTRISETQLLPGEVHVIPVPEQLFRIFALRRASLGRPQSAVNRNNLTTIGSEPYIQSACIDVPAGSVVVLANGRNGRPVFASYSLGKTIFASEDMVATAGEYDI